MSAGLASLVERYLQERRRLGFDLSSPAYCLRSLAGHVGRSGHRGPLTMELMAAWARQDSHASGDPRTWARRLKSLRSFTRWLQQFEPRTEVPDDAIFGRLSERQAPHIYTEQEILDLLAAARRLGPSPGLRGLVFETLFGLIACTGMRVSEALGLRNGDVDLQRGLLTIRRTKFAKSRQVPVHQSTAQALNQYRWLRDLAGASQDEQAPFLINTRGTRRGTAVDRHHAERVFRGLREAMHWTNRGAHHAPRIHDLRHTFIVNRILNPQLRGQAPLLPSRDGHAMTRCNVAQRLALAVDRATATHPGLAGKRVSPHTLRHTTAMHLLQSGVPFNVIALWLGHESVNTTHRYVEANLAMKEKALARLDAPDTKLRRFRPSDSLMRFLQEL